MKSIFIALLVLAAAGLGAFSFHQRSQLAQAQKQLADAQDQLKAAQDQLSQRAEMDQSIAFEQKRAQALQQTLAAASAEAAKSSEQVSSLKQSLAAAETNAENKGLTGLFKNPEMREMIKQQQKMVMGPMIDKMYADLFKQLNLSPDQSAQIKDLLQQKMLAGAEMGMSMLDGADAAKRADLVKDMKSQGDAIDEQMKQLLGDENYKQFKEYEKTTGNRVTVSQFRDHLANNSAGALSPTQERQLIDAMQQQSTDFKWTTNPTQYETPGGDMDFAELFNESRLNKLAEEKLLYDQQLLPRARGILNDQQYKEYEKYLENQRQMQITAMKMAAAMFGQSRPATPPGTQR